MTKWLVIALTCLALSAAAQPSETLDLTAIGKDPKWKIANRTASISEAKGKRALKISEAPGSGIAWLDGFDFVNGVIEIDLLGRSQPIQGSFVGVAFHAVDGQTYDAVYFRPFNFRAQDPDRHSHAVQYISLPQFEWDVLRSQHPGQYEKAVVPEPDGDEWFHARIVVQNPDVKVYVNGAATPALSVKELSDRSHGSVGVWVGNASGGYFANLKVTRAK